MTKLKEIWKKKSIFERMAMLITILLSCCVIILSVIGLTGIVTIDITNSIVIPLLGIVTLLNGLVTYKKNKLTGTIALLCAGFIFVCCISVFAMKF